jgi:hypothetical protein
MMWKITNLHSHLVNCHVCSTQRVCAAFWALSGMAGIEKGLRTNRDSGLSLDETNFDDEITFEEATSGHACTSICLYIYE